jgi:pimeloyl-ACP methyl ester carboxylesterase
VRTFLLVHGAWHGGWVWEATAAALRDAGDRTWTPTLRGCGERFREPHRNVALSDHISDVVEVLEGNDLRDVVLVGHSYAGMVITGAADRCRTRIHTLVYLDAFVPESGERAADFIPNELNEKALAAVHAAGKGTHLPVIYPASKFVDFDAERSAAFMARLTPQPFLTYLEPVFLAHPPAVNRGFIYCTAAPLGLFDRFAARARIDPDWSYAELPAAHDAMLTHPRQLAAELRAMATRAEGDAGRTSAPTAKPE